MITSYPSIFAVYHRAARNIWSVPVNIEEKVDGSQISFGILDGELMIKSKGARIVPDAPEGMFASAVRTIQTIEKNLIPGYTYRGEFLRTPKHNVLHYDRIPVGHIILFDIDKGVEDYMSYEEKVKEAQRIGLEVVPLLGSGEYIVGLLPEFFSKISILGGQKIEGVVVKPRDRNLFGEDKKLLIVKYVSSEFKETMAGTDNPHADTGSKDIILQLVEYLRTPARWRKAVQHLKEAGNLSESPKDIGPLIKEIISDIHKEESEVIKDKLFVWAWKMIARGITTGLPEWYKNELLEANKPDEILGEALTTNTINNNT